MNNRLIVDEYGQVLPNEHNAEVVANKLNKGMAVSIPVVFDSTLAHITFVLGVFSIVRDGVTEDGNYQYIPYNDGGAGGLIIAIDRAGCYSYPLGQGDTHYNSYTEKLHYIVTPILATFFNDIKKKLL